MQLHARHLKLSNAARARKHATLFVCTAFPTRSTALSLSRSRSLSQLQLPAWHAALIYASRLKNELWHFRQAKWSRPAHHFVFVCRWWGGILSLCLSLSVWHVRHVMLSPFLHMPKMQAVSAFGQLQFSLPFTCPATLAPAAPAPASAAAAAFAALIWKKFCAYLLQNSWRVRPATDATSCLWLGRLPSAFCRCRLSRRRCARKWTQTQFMHRHRSQHIIIVT